MNSNRLKHLLVSLSFLFVVGLAAYFLIWQWVFCRIYIPPNYLMYVNAKIGAENTDPDAHRVVDEGVKGIQRRIYGEGRYFINPVFQDRVLVPNGFAFHDKEDRGHRQGYIKPLEIGVVDSFSGQSLPHGEFLAREGQKGTMRNPLTPGKWRLNPRAYKVTTYPALQIHPGYVGCVTSLSGVDPPEGQQLAREGQRGIMERVLQPGLYYVNPKAYKVEAIDVGYRQKGFTEVNFPSKDGFDIKVDVSVVWGLLPQNVPYIQLNLGNLNDVVDKIIRPQVVAICREEGPKYKATEFIEGESRENFQRSFTNALITVCSSKKVEILIGLVRQVIIPPQVSEPIQKSRIAQEETETKVALQETQKVFNQLSELKREVEKGIREVQADTEKAVANLLAKGDKEIAAIRVSQEVEVSRFNRDIAARQAEITRILGTARAQATELTKKAEADRMVQNVKAMGSAQAYADYIFARNLPPELKIFIRHTGLGTFWTDIPQELKTMEKMAAAKILQENKPVGEAKASK